MASRFKTSGRRLRAALVAGGLVGALVAAAGGVPAQAQAGGGVPFGGGATTNFGGYSTGAAVHVDALTAAPEGPRIVDGEIAFSSAAFQSNGLSPINNEMGIAVVPTAGAAEAPVSSDGAESYGKGSGVEVGLATDLPNDDLNQIKLTQAGAASAPPVRSDGEPPLNPASTGLVQTTLVDVPAGPLLFAGAARGKAGAVWNANTCIAGQPISFGEGHVAQVDVLDTGEQDPETGEHGAPVVTLNSTENQEAVESQSITYLVPNTNGAGVPDGTYGVVSETQMILAPVTLAEDATTGQGALTIEIAGTWLLRVHATGQGPATVEYGLQDPPADPDTPIISFFQDGDLVGGLNFQDIFGEEGLVLPPEISTLLTLAIGENPRDIAPPNTANPDTVGDPFLTVTEGRAAVDVLRLGLLNLGDPEASPAIAGLRVGHMEAKVTIPAGGIKCQFPVKKEGPSTVTSNQEFTWTITIPSDPNALAGVACKLTGISAIDTIFDVTGSPGVRITGVNGPAGSSSTIAANGQSASVTGLGEYDPNNPNRQPITFDVKAIATGAGTFKNMVDVTAKLTDCTGGGFFEGQAELADFLANARITGDNAVVGGAQILGVGQTAAPTSAVLAQRVLPQTGASRGLTMLGIMAMLTAAGVYLFNRKVSGNSA
jgi:LPXTG-motif cell wall-anchored protein